eukprot:Hpha_TRINITY_DN16451_c2_g4::TRINITY_DN16451_c2_g4_i1::g.163161::m.163161
MFLVLHEVAHVPRPVLGDEFPLPLPHTLLVVTLVVPPLRIRVLALTMFQVVHESPLEAVSILEGKHTVPMHAVILPVTVERMLGALVVPLPVLLIVHPVPSVAVPVGARKSAFPRLVSLRPLPLVLVSGRVNHHTKVLEHTVLEPALVDLPGLEGELSLPILHTRLKLPLVHSVPLVPQLSLSVPLARLPIPHVCSTRQFAHQGTLAVLLALRPVSFVHVPRLGPRKLALTVELSILNLTFVLTNREGQLLNALARRRPLRLHFRCNSCLVRARGFPLFCPLLLPLLHLAAHLEFALVLLLLLLALHVLHLLTQGGVPLRIVHYLTLYRVFSHFVRHVACPPPS